MREEKTFVFEAFQRAWGIAEGQRFFVLGMCVCVLFLFLAEVWGFFSSVCTLFFLCKYILSFQIPFLLLDYSPTSSRVPFHPQ
jgi:hypothetical protein